MSKGNSTQSGKRAEKLLGKWGAFCVKRPQAALTGLVLFAIAGFIAAYITWFPYASPVSQLPKNFDDRLAWEETSRRIQFNSEIMLRVSVADSDTPSSVGGDVLSSHRRQKSEQNLAAAIEQLKRKLSGSQKHFCDVLTSLDMQPAQTRELCELSHDDLQMLYAELLDARLVLGGQWSLLESANYADWLSTRLQRSHDELVETAASPVNMSPNHAANTAKRQAALLQNRRLLESAARFTAGLQQNLANPSQPHSASAETLSPWQLNPDMLFARADSQSAAEAVSGVNPPAAENETVVVWVKLAEPQLAGLLDRRVIGKTKKIDYKLLKKLDVSLAELHRIIDDVSAEHAGVQIEPFGVPIDVQHSRVRSPGTQWGGLPVVFAVLMLFFVAGIRHIRVCMAVLLSMLCSFGVYLGLTAIWFEMITPYALFIGIAVLVFGACADVIMAAAWLKACERGYSASEAIVEMMRNAGGTVLRGGLISLTVFLAGVFYLWYLPYEPTALTLSFRSSLTGVNLALFLLAQAVLACLCGSLVALPALIRVLAPDGRGLSVSRSASRSSSRSTASGRAAFDLVKAMPTVPLAANVGLTVMLLGCCLYLISRPQSPDSQADPFVTHSEKRAVAMPILVSQQVFEQYDQQYDRHNDPHNDRQSVPGLFACDASGLLAGYDAGKAVVIDDMSRIVDHTSEQQKITLPDHDTLHDSLVELHRQLARQFDALQQAAASEGTPSENTQRSAFSCCRAAENIAAICRLLPQLSATEYYGRLDAYQQAVAGDLVVQQKRLQARLYHSRSQRNDASPAVTRRFLDAEQRPIIWLFPRESRPTLAHREQLQRFFAPYVFGETVSIEVSPNALPNDNAGAQGTQCGGFPLLVLSGRQLVQQQLPSLGAVMLIALLVPICLAHRSVPVGAMTILVVAGGLSCYGILLTMLALPFDRVTVFPIVLFPLAMPLFLDMFRRRNASPDHFRANLGTMLVCFGVGIVAVGYLMFSRDTAVAASGRVMIIGWSALMFPLLINLISVLKPRNTNRAATSPSATVMPSFVAPVQAEHIPAPEQPVTLSERPASLATRDQLDFYRDRIAASQVFDRQPAAPAFDETEHVFTEAETVEAEAFDYVANHNANHDTGHDAVEMAEMPAFPSVWSVGTKHRSTQTVVVELPASAAAFADVSRVEAAVSLARKTSPNAKTTLTARVSQHAHGCEPAHETRESDSPPTILPIRGHVSDVGIDTDVAASEKPKPKPKRRKSG